MKSQLDQILAHLQAGHSLTQLEAYELFGCTRLGGRIYDLREEGHKIESEMVTVRNRHQQPTQVARYTLPKPAPVQLELTLTAEQFANSHS